jgi:hypothetical protein
MSLALRDLVQQLALPDLGGPHPSVEGLNRTTGRTTLHDSPYLVALSCLST